MVFQLQPQLKIFIIPNTYSPTKPHMDQTIAPTPLPKKIQHTTTLAILVPHDELVMTSYMRIRLAIVETHYHNLINFKNQGRFKIVYLCTMGCRLTTLLLFLIV